MIFIGKHNRGWNWSRYSLLKILQCKEKFSTKYSLGKYEKIWIQKYWGNMNQDEELKCSVNLRTTSFCTLFSFSFMTTSACRNPISPYCKPLRWNFATKACVTKRYSATAILPNSVVPFTKVIFFNSPNADRVFLNMKCSSFLKDRRPLTITLLTPTSNNLWLLSAITKRWTMSGNHITWMSLWKEKADPILIFHYTKVKMLFKLLKKIL